MLLWLTNLKAQVTLQEFIIPLVSQSEDKWSKVNHLLLLSFHPDFWGLLHAIANNVFVHLLYYYNEPVINHRLFSREFNYHYSSYLFTTISCFKRSNIDFSHFYFFWFFKQYGMFPKSHTTTAGLLQVEKVPTESPLGKGECTLWWKCH